MSTSSPVDRLSERRRGLVGRDIQQAHPPAPIGVGGLPADRADSQAEDLLNAQAGEQPQQRDSADQLEWIPRRACSGLVAVLGQIVLAEVQPCPHQLGPDLVRNHTRIGADQRGD
jgi:hypothetical protein